MVFWSWWQNRRNTMPSVVQSWMSNLTMKQQTAVLSALRGPDTNSSDDIKVVVKILRAIVLENADMTSEYMEFDKNTLQIPSKRNIEALPLHYFVHLTQALHIISKLHPIEKIRNIFKPIYDIFLNNILHLNDESVDALNSRLADKDQLNAKYRS